MRWPVSLLALLAAVSSVRSQKSSDEFESQLYFPNNGLPDLVPYRRNTPEVRQAQSRADCDASCRKDNTGAESDNEWRLSKDVIPSHYDLRLDADLDNFSFDGIVEITIEAKQNTEQITLHVDNLTITATPQILKIIDQEDGTISREKWGCVLSIDEDEEHLRTTFHLSKALKDGPYILEIKYSGEIRKDLHGFYRSSYKVGNETRWLATTQFEPTHARRAFPCFDEPNFKASFDISITHDVKYTALSNMPIKFSECKNNSRVTDKFERTAKMSTYLIAFIISDFKSYKTGNEPPISSVWASEKYIKDANYSQEMGVKVVGAMVNFTSIPFALPKIDHVAIPDFAAGAMENWGLITYRDYLLIKTNESTTPIKQFIPGVIAHEVAHQWFGNLVTLDWWSYTWLNEGFATFFEYFITEQVTDGKFGMWNQFIPSKFQVALELDGNPSTSVAMTSKASTPEEIAAKFDQISYGKGGCILTMISELLTIKNFQKGLRSYLDKKKFSNAKPDDLFSEWEDVSFGTLPKNITFTDFARSWTEQDGVPVVTAIRDYETGEVTFTQQRYYDKKPGCPCGYNRRWWIPLTWISQKNAENVDNFKPQAWLRGDKNENVVVPTMAKSREWLLVNPRSIGYFRVNYDTKNWQILTKSLSENHSQFPLRNRAQILNDAFSLASSGHLDFAVALETFNFLHKERDTSVWMSATRIISRLVDELGPTEAYPMLEEYGVKILTKVYLTLGLKVDPNEEHAKSLLRYYVAPWACIFGVTQCLKDAAENLKNHKEKSIHPDVVIPTVCGAVRGADEATFWKIRERVGTVPSIDLKQTITSALGRCHPNDTLIKEHLKDSLKDDSVIPRNITHIAIQQVLAAPSKFRVGFEFIKENLDTLLNVIGKDKTTSLVLVLVRRVRTESHYKQVSDWLKANINELDDPENVTSELTSSKSNIEWNVLYLSDLSDWLAATLGHEPPDTIPTPPAPTENPRSTGAHENTSTPEPPRNFAVVCKGAPVIVVISYILVFFL